ncbi:MAG: DUF2812 domain-containing protein [Lachnospiraceae bacterium]|nr:DUF2812 domain-containing protein [Lachnospiraceae bacterium]
MRKTVFHIFTIADFNEEEEWLRNKHKNGWKLVKMTPPCFYTFEKCEPEDVVYRLDYKNSKRTEDYMMMLQDFGWEYLAECFGWLYFRKGADSVASEQDAELFSDNESRLEMVNHVVKTRFFPLCVLFLCCVLPGLTNTVLDGNGGIVGACFSVAFGILFAIYVVLILYCGAKLRKMKKQISKL